MNEVDERNEFLKKIDNIELVSDEELAKMDFYELAFYMQSLNQISLLGEDVTVIESEGGLYE